MVGTNLLLGGMSFVLSIYTYSLFELDAYLKVRKAKRSYRQETGIRYPHPIPNFLGSFSPSVLYRHAETIRKDTETLKKFKSKKTNSGNGPRKLFLNPRGPTH